MKYFVSGLLALGFVFAYAQDVRPTHHTDTTGQLYWRKSTPVYLFVSDNPDGPSTRLKSQSTPKYADPLYLDTEGVNYIRTREAVDPVTMQIVPNVEVTFEIYADGIPPTSKIVYDKVNKYKGQDAIYYKNGISISLSTQDALSGVRKLNYSINEAPFKEYDSTIIFDISGEYVLKMFAEDNVGNVEETQTVTFIVDNQPPTTKLNINSITDDNVISAASKMYLISYDSASGVSKVFYKFDDLPYQLYDGKSINFTNLNEDNHTVTFYSVDNVTNEEETQSFSFFFDKTAPLMVADVLGDRFIVGDDIYFSGRTKLKLTAVDNKVGVKEIKFSVDDTPFMNYEKPFYLPSVSGVHLIRYYSVDNLNNSTADSRRSNYLGKGGFEEFKHSVSKFYVDLTGPIIDYKIGNYSFLREDTLYIGPSTKITLIGKDMESGLKELSYSVNREYGEVIYTEPFSLNTEGYTTLNFYGYDNVNNRNVSKFHFYLDATKPQIFIQFNTGSVRMKGELEVYPLTTGIFLSATDKTAGISSLYYKLDDQPEKSYAGLINNIGKGKHTIVIRAVDFLNNETTEKYDFILKD
jgi:hypothetical protein